MAVHDPYLVQRAQYMIKSDKNNLEQKLHDAKYELAAFKATIVNEVKRNYILESELKELDYKIELLIKNRITVKDVLASSGNLLDGTNEKPGGHSLNAQTQTFERLFYILQQTPKHLAHIAPCAKSDEIHSLVQTVVFTIYGDQYDIKEERLLLMMFQEVLKAEFEKCNDIGTFLRGNSAITTMLTAYTRRNPGMATLKACLVDQLEKLKASDQNFEVNPLKVHQWLINDYETRTGNESPLDKQADSEAAAACPEVIELVAKRQRMLSEATQSLVEIIFAYCDKMPFGIRWICKQLLEMGRAKFPDADRHQLGSLVGGFVFLRFFNPSIVAPEVSGLLAKKPSAMLRRNLILIAKLIQNTSNGVLMGAKEDHMAGLNSFVSNNRDPFTAYFEELCKVDELDEALKVDRYLEVISADRVLNMQFNEVQLIHSLLHRAPRTNDETLNALMDQLGPVPDKLPREENFMVNIKLVKPALSESNLNEETMDQLLLESKSKALSLLRASSDSAPNASFYSFVQKAKETPHLAADVDTLQAAMDRIVQGGGYGGDGPARESHYEMLLKEMTEYLNNRDSLVERLDTQKTHLSEVILSIREHHSTMQTKIDSYKDYLTNVRAMAYKSKKPSKSSKTKSVKYSTAEMEEKGILVDSRLGSDVKKHLSFVFKSLPDDGVFSVTASMRGLSVMTINLDFEELLERQHQNQLAFEVEDVTLNVNKLIYLLNKKFILAENQP